MTRKLPIVLWVLVVFALIGVGWLWLKRMDDMALTPTDLGRGDYQLKQMDGAPFTQNTLIGAPSLVFFGFTHCPDVCPTTIGDIGSWRDALGAEWAGLRVFFISVDPERDSPEILSEYVGWMPGVLGITGPLQEIDKAIRAFRVFARKVPLECDDYTMDHSSSVLMFDRKGRLQGTIPYQSALEEALGKIRLTLKN